MREKGAVVGVAGQYIEKRKGDVTAPFSSPYLDRQY